MARSVNHQDHILKRCERNPRSPSKVEKNGPSFLNGEGGIVLANFYQFVDHKGTINTLGRKYFMRKVIVAG